MLDVGRKVSVLLAVMWGAIMVGYFSGSLYPSTFASAFMALLIALTHVIEALEDGK